MYLSREWRLISFCGRLYCHLIFTFSSKTTITSPPIHSMFFNLVALVNGYLFPLFLSLSWVLVDRASSNGYGGGCCWSPLSSEWHCHCIWDGRRRRPPHLMGDMRTADAVSNAPYRGIFGWFILWPFSCKYNTNTRQIACRLPCVCIVQPVYLPQ